MDSLFNTQLTRATRNLPQFMLGTVQTVDMNQTTATIHFDGSETSIPNAGVPPIFSDGTNSLNTSQTVIALTGDIPVVIGGSPWITSNPQ